MPLGVSRTYGDTKVPARVVATVKRIWTKMSRRTAGDQEKMAHTSAQAPTPSYRYRETKRSVIIRQISGEQREKAAPGSRCRLGSGERDLKAQVRQDVGGSVAFDVGGCGALRLIGVGVAVGVTGD